MRRGPQGKAHPLGATGGETRADNADAAAISELFESHNRALVSFLVNRLGNEAEAKEVAQEAYVRLLQLGQSNTVSFLRAYLFRVAANLAVDRQRARMRSDRYDEVKAVEELTDLLEPERQLSSAEALGIVQQALQELPVRYREIFYWGRIEERTTAEIGQSLGISERQVRTYLRRTLVYCQLCLDGMSPKQASERMLSL